MFKCSNALCSCIYLFAGVGVAAVSCDALLQILRESQHLLNKMGPTAFINSQIVLK